MLSRTVWSPSRRKTPHLTYNLPNTACVGLIADTSRPRCGNVPSRRQYNKTVVKEGNDSSTHKMIHIWYRQHFFFPGTRDAYICSTSRDNRAQPLLSPLLSQALETSGPFWYNTAFRMMQPHATTTYCKANWVTPSQPNRPHFIVVQTSVLHKKQTNAFPLMRPCRVLYCCSLSEQQI